MNDMATIDSISMCMDEIDSYDKEKQLQLLIKEINIITTNIIKLSSEWYDLRINKINEYFSIIHKITRNFNIYISRICR